MTVLILEEITLGLSKPDCILIRNLSLSVPSAEIVTVMGPSGSGKSTLLSFISGHLDPAFSATGSIRLDDREVTTEPPESRHIGMLFQDDMLFPHLSVGANLAFGLTSNIKSRKDRRLRIEEALTSAGLGGFADRDPATLSGGQRTRVALMRTLLSEPDALLLDEPFSKLDQNLRADMRSFVFAHAAEQKLPVLMVTHDEADAEAAGGQIVRLEG